MNLNLLLILINFFNLFKDGVIGDGSTKVVRSVPEKWWKKPGNYEDNHIIFDVVNDENSKTQIRKFAKKL